MPRRRALRWAVGTVVLASAFTSCAKDEHVARGSQGRGDAGGNASSTDDADNPDAADDGRGDDSRSDLDVDATDAPAADASDTEQDVSDDGNGDPDPSGSASVMDSGTETADAPTRNDGVDASGAELLDAAVVPEDPAVRADAEVPATGSCDVVGQACCADSTCGAELSCAGDACTCVEAIGGISVMREQGHVVSHDGAPNVVVDAATQQPLSGARQVVGGHWHACAVLADDTVSCWPRSEDGNDAAQLGNGTLGGVVTPFEASPVLLAPAVDGAEGTLLSGVRSLSERSANGYVVFTNCAVLNDGGIVCWGDDEGNIPQRGSADSPYAYRIRSDETTLVQDAISVGVGRRHACYLSEAKTVHCWGTNFGSLGDGTTDASTFPVRAGDLAGVSQIGIGSDFSCALIGEGEQAGRVYCWGRSANGQFGIGDPTASTDGCTAACKVLPTAMQTGPDSYLENVVELRVGYHSTCAMTAEGQLYCTGTFIDTEYATLVQHELARSWSQWLFGKQDELRFLSSDGQYYHWQQEGANPILVDTCEPLD